jgi:hypothetical protein
MSYIEIEKRHFERAKYFVTFMSGWSIGIWTIPTEVFKSGTEMGTRYYPVNNAFILALLVIPILYYGIYHIKKNELEKGYEDNGIKPD